KVKGEGSGYGLFGRPIIEVTAASDDRYTTDMIRKDNGHTSNIPLYLSTALNPVLEEIAGLKDMMDLLIKQPGIFRINGFHKNIRAIYQEMILNGVDDKIALQLIEDANKCIPEERLEKEGYVRSFIIDAMMRLIRVGGDIRLEKGKQKIAAFIGPTGGGKTTTIAKLAAEYVLLRNKDVALITIDTYRIGGVEQLNIYADIIGIPVYVVLSQSELRRAIESYRDKDLILIDTPGRGQRDKSRLSELMNLLSGERSIEKYLVLSATTRDEGLSEIIENFSPLSIDSLLFTKIDEGVSFGSIINRSIHSGKPLSYLTTGQRVPEDIEIATLDRIVNLILKN
ncbi:MAG: hypothetical protein HY999_01530, partial [Nitrospinae bacterium]|nr:hypothetical protein [Nitrospinota bacterium]